MRKEMKNKAQDNVGNEQLLGYRWWLFYSTAFIIIIWLFLFGVWSGFFNISEAGVSGDFIAAIGITTAILLTWFLSLISYNRSAFLLATIFSLNPLLWIGNGIYLRNRWNQVPPNKTESSNV